jgi:hypothetical protein
MAPRRLRLVPWVVGRGRPASWEVWLLDGSMGYLVTKVWVSMLLQVAHWFLPAGRMFESHMCMLRHMGYSCSLFSALQPHHLGKTLGRWCVCLLCTPGSMQMEGMRPLTRLVGGAAVQCVCCVSCTEQGCTEAVGQAGPAGCSGSRPCKCRDTNSHRCVLIDLHLRCTSTGRERSKHVCTCRGYPF